MLMQLELRRSIESSDNERNQFLGSFLLVYQSEYERLTSFPKEKEQKMNSNSQSSPSTLPNLSTALTRNVDLSVVLIRPSNSFSNTLSSSSRSSSFAPVSLHLFPLIYFKENPNSVPAEI